jgi:hypothetical protein
MFYRRKNRRALSVALGCALAPTQIALRGRSEGTRGMLSWRSGRAQRVHLTLSAHFGFEFTVRAIQAERSLKVEDSSSKI